MSGNYRQPILKQLHNDELRQEFFQQDGAAAVTSLSKVTLFRIIIVTMSNYYKSKTIDHQFETTRLLSDHINSVIADHYKKMCQKIRIVSFFIGLGCLLDYFNLYTDQ